MNHSLSIDWWRPEAAPDTAYVPGTVAPSRPRDSSVPFWGLVTFTVILIVSPQGPVLQHLRLALVAAVITGASYLWGRLVHRRPLSVSAREIRLAAWLALWAVATVPFAIWRGGSASFLFNVYFKTLVIFWLLCNVVDTPAKLRKILWTMTLLTVPLAVASIWHFLSADFLKEAAGRIYGYDAPLTENPNDLALMLNLMIPLGVALFFVQKKVLVRAFLFAILCLDAVAVIVTFSRAGFVGLAITSIIYLFKFLKRPQHGWALLAMLLVFLSFPLLPRGYLARLATITSIESDPTGSAQQRWTDTFAALHYVAKHPIFGAGAGMSDLALNEERGPQWQVIHNAYLEYAVDLGLPGLVLFLFLLACCLKSVKIAQRRIAKVPALKGLFLLAEGIQVSLIVFAFAALFHPVGFQYYFYYLAGLAVASRAVCEFEGRRWSRAGSSS